MPEPSNNYKSRFTGSLGQKFKQSNSSIPLPNFEKITSSDINSTFKDFVSHAVFDVDFNELQLYYFMVIGFDAKQEGKAEAKKHRPSVWTRMLLTGTLILGLAAGVGATDMASKNKTKAQPKEETLITQAAKEETRVAQTRKPQMPKENATASDVSNRKDEKPHCSKASKRVIIAQTPYIFTAETCDDWDYFSTSWEHRKIKRQRSISEAIRKIGGVFTNREINVGVDGCESVAIKGEAATYWIILAPIFASERTANILGVGQTYGTLIDTEVLVDGTAIQIEQLKDSCDWIVKLFRGRSGPYILRVSEKGQVIEDSTKPISRTAMDK